MELRPWQPEAVEFGLTANRWVLGDPPGAGKTITALTWLARSNAKRTLIVAPNAVLGQWRGAAWDWNDDRRTYVATSTPEKRALVYAGVARAVEPVTVITSYDLLRRDSAELLKLKFDTVIADEAHRLKDRKALQSKEATKLARRAERVCFATGTPVINEAEELWSYLHMLDPKGYPSFWKWARTHFDILTPTYGYGLQPVTEVGDMLPGHAELIREECRGLVLARTPEDIWPGKLKPTETVVEVELTAEERKAYTALTKGWMQLGDEVVVASNAVARITRARQLSSDWRNLSSDLPAGSKTQAAIELARYLDRPVLILAAFRGTAELIAEALGGSLYLGGMSAKDRTIAMETFRGGGTKAFVGTLAAVGEGLDGLQHTAADLIAVDREWSPFRNQQVVGRLDREGQTKPVNVWHVVAKDTVDQDVAKALAAKQTTIDTLDLSSLR